LRDKKGFRDDLRVDALRHSIFLSYEPQNSHTTTVAFYCMQDVNHLQLVRSLSTNLPIFFVHMPSSEETSGMTEVDRNEFINHGGLNFTAESDGAASKPEVHSAGQTNLITKPLFLDQIEFLGMQL